MNAYKGQLCWVWYRSAWFSRAQLLVSCQRSCHMPQYGILSVLPPNRRLQLTPLRVEQDRGFFESQFRLGSHLDLVVRRN